MSQEPQPPLNSWSSLLVLARSSLHPNIQCWFWPTEEAKSFPFGGLLGWQEGDQTMAVNSRNCGWPTAPINSRWQPPKPEICQPSRCGVC